MAVKSEKKVQPRCGLCGVEFGSVEEWDEHARTPEHQRKLREYGLPEWARFALFTRE